MFKDKRYTRALAIAGLAFGALNALAPRPAAAELKAKQAAGKVGIKSSEDEFKGKLDTHVKEKLSCSVKDGAIGQYASSPVPGVAKMMVGCHAPKPLCFLTDVSGKLEEWRKGFITSLNTRFGSSEDVNQLLGTTECALTSEATSVSLNVDVKHLVTGVSAKVDFSFGIAYKSASKISLGKNDAFPKLQEGTTYPLAKGEVITSYVNYDRTFSFKCSVIVDTTVTDVDVNLALNYTGKDLHQCSTTEIAGTDKAPALDCPKK
jgi:hypothetical protein